MPYMPVPRLARAGEAPTLQRLVDEAYGHYVARLGRKPAPMTDDYARRIADGQAWVLDGEAGVVGLAVLEDMDDALLLDNVAVSPAARGTGLGRALIAFAEAETRRRGLPALRLYTNARMTENIAMYTRIGFVETDRVSEDGFERVYMVKAIPPAG